MIIEPSMRATALPPGLAGAGPPAPSGFEPRVIRKPVERETGQQRTRIVTRRSASLELSSGALTSCQEPYGCLSMCEREFLQ